MLVLRKGEIILSARNRRCYFSWEVCGQRCRVHSQLYYLNTWKGLNLAQIEHCVISTLHFSFSCLDMFALFGLTICSQQAFHLKKHLRIICVKLLDSYEELWVNGYSRCSTWELQILPIVAQNVEFISVNHWLINWHPYQAKIIITQLIK